MSPRWGIVSAGKISHDFVTAVHSAPGGGVRVAAVAARDSARAKEFARLHGIQRVFDCYEDMARSKEIDVAYIGALNHSHYELSKLFLENGKHVLCEKPLCLNIKQVRSLVELAKQKSLFLMDAVWSRFLPSYLALEKELQSGKLGEILYVNANFGIPDLSKVERIVTRQVGGGTVLDLGVYALQFAQLVFKEEPTKVSASGTLTASGVDEAVSVILEYSGGRRAVLSLHSRVKIENYAAVVGTKGSVKLHDPFHCCERLQTVEGSVQSYPLPPGRHPFNFLNSGGLVYQALEVNKCIEKGMIESARMSHADSLLLAKLEDNIRAQLGVHYDADDNHY